MVSRSTGRGSVLLAGLLAAIAVVSTGCARSGTGSSPTGLATAGPSQASSAPSEAPHAPQFPMPEGETILAVLDPAVVKPKVSAEEAVALAFDVFVHQVPEPPPRVQLLRLHLSGTGSDFEYAEVWTGWVIFSTEVRWRGGYGPFAVNPSTRPSMAATFTWIYVSLDGEVLRQTKYGYDTVVMVPSLPPD